MPKIEHLAIYCRNLENMRDFYSKYFGGINGEKYINEAKGFQSYFLRFEDRCRLELMSKTSVNIESPSDEYYGFIHIAISVGSKNKVDELTQSLAKDGFSVIGQPRTTGDGYYESVILDPENNRIEITI